MTNSFKNALKNAITAAFYHLLVSIGRETPASVASGPLLVIAPHPDDETLGCGGLILAHKEKGVPVRILIVTDGGASSRPETVPLETLTETRKTEALEATRRLNIQADEVFFLAYQDGKALSSITTIAQNLASHIELFAPTLIAAPYEFDFHPDHQAVAQALVIAMKNTKSKAKIWEYPMWFWPRGALSFLLSQKGRKSLRLHKATPHLQLKRYALSAYTSQIPSSRKEEDSEWEKLSESFIKNNLREYELFFDRYTFLIN